MKYQGINFSIAAFKCESLKVVRIIYICLCATHGVILFPYFFITEIWKFKKFNKGNKHYGAVDEASLEQQFSEYSTQVCIFIV